MTKCLALTQKNIQCKLYGSHQENKFYYIHNKIYNEHHKIELYDGTFYENGNIIKKINNKKKLINQILNQNQNLNQKLLLEEQRILFEFFESQKKLKQQKITENKVIPKEKCVKKFEFDKNKSYECKCCFTEYPCVEMIHCSNATENFEHIFCKDCIKGYITTAINDNNATNKCMCDTKEENCCGIFSHQDIKDCLEENVYANYEDSVLVKEIISLSKSLENYEVCSLCNKYGVCCDYTLDDKKFIECKRCLKSWCRICKKESHGLDSCYKIKDENDIATMTKLVTETLTEAITHKCPKCFTKYIKLEGCNKMTCPTCKSYSCYICGIQVYSYAHFYDKYNNKNEKRTCVLFNDYDYGGNARDQGNNKYNNKKVINKCNQLLEENNNDVIRNNLIEIMKKNDVDIKLLDAKYKKYIKQKETICSIM